MFRKIVYIFALMLPWPARRRVLQLFLGYRLHPTSRIGFAWVMPDRLVMESHSSIGNLSVCKGISQLHLGQYATIGRLNWITGYPAHGEFMFKHQNERMPQLILGEHSAITNRHLVDATATVRIGRYSTFAGFRSQILTHSIDLAHSRQAAAPIEIGDYCFVGTDSVLLGGSVLPDYCVLGAKSLLNKSLTEKFCLYAGSPARKVKNLPRDWGYFTREVGRVT